MSNGNTKKILTAGDNSVVVPTGIKRHLNWKQKIIGLLPLNIVAPGFYAASFFMDRTLDPVSYGFILTAAIAGAGFSIPLMTEWKRDHKSKLTSEFLEEKGVSISPDRMAKAISQIKKKDRVLLAAFYLSEVAEIDAETLKPSGYVTPHSATHEVRQYLSLRAREFVIEQAVIPNEETIWDLSADALVEVYSVKEAKSIKA